MHVWKDKEGKKLTASEFMTRWKEGIAKVSMLDKLKMQILFGWIVIIGIIIGIISVIIGHLWWLLVILIGSLGLSSISLLTTYQQYMAYKKIDDMLKVEDSQKEVQNGS